MENVDASMPQQPEQKLELSASAAEYLNETRKWSMFLAILGFLFVGMIALASLFLMFGSAASPLGDTFGAIGFLGGFFYLMTGALYFFPIFYLFMFAFKTKKALSMTDNQTLEGALKNLKSHYKFIGILTILIIALYVLFFMFAGVGALTSFM